MDFNRGTTDKVEFNVSEGALWHTSMDLYYGYQPGEIVEVEHEANKYWLATVEYCFKHLVLLKWFGDYGEFWVDTSGQNLSNASCASLSEFSTPRRLFPPGYHLQSQLKSQFTLERPTRILVTPSLYNPANDPYSQIITVDDLLALELDEPAGVDAYGNQTSATINQDPASLAIAKCKTKVSYKQEDVDELEAALQNLNDIEEEKTDPNVEHQQLQQSKQNENNIPDQVEQPDTIETEADTPGDEILIEKIKKIQESAISKGRYLGIGDSDKKVYYLKPRQFFDNGGANHERVFVPGTLLEVCHSVENNFGLELCHWFATVIKNIGGRLTLRWFICDEPRFKQGRLELKTIKSEFICEDDPGENSDDLRNNDNLSNGSSPVQIPVKSITFCLHYCSPSIHTISHAKSTLRVYRMPTKMFSFIEEIKGSEDAYSIEQAQMEHVFDPRRINLDRDRSMIDHLLSYVRWKSPKYTNITFAPKDTNSKREVLLSTPRTTKLLRGYIKRELEAGVYEINSDPLPDSEEIIKFIYPYDSSFTVLPKSWADNNPDCLSIDPSRDPSPMPIESTPEVSSNEDNSNQKIISNEKIENTTQIADAESNKVPVVSRNFQGTCDYKAVKVEPYNLLCEIAKTNLMEMDYELNHEGIENPRDFDFMEPTCWSQLIRARELQAPEFSCIIDEMLKDYVMAKFKVMDQLEVVHPSSDVTLCLGRIRKIVYPLLWIQISADSYTLLPFSSTDIYPNRWSESNNHPLISLLPPRKRINQSCSQADKKRKRTKNSNNDDIDRTDEFNNDQGEMMYEKENFDLGAMSVKQSNFDLILDEKTTYIRIYFNHKCFTGPSLSKSKICTLPQYVGPGPLRLVMEEVVTKVISVAYVPPRILNDLSSNSFEELLIARNLTNTAPMEFKAKYQKRVHREEIPVCLNPDDVSRYCECLCEHLKCCFHLFGPNLYDGDDCPGHCRVMTKSNKFMKRATYYREKARNGELSTDGSTKKSNNTNSSSNNKATSRPQYNGRESSDSTSSTLSRSDQVNSRASSAADDIPTTEFKENLVTVAEMEHENDKDDVDSATKTQKEPEDTKLEENSTLKESEPEMDKILHSSDQTYNNVSSLTSRRQSPRGILESEFSSLEETNPFEWTIDDVGNCLDWFHLGKFKSFMSSEVSGNNFMKRI